MNATVCVSKRKRDGEVKERERKYCVVSAINRQGYVGARNNEHVHTDRKLSLYINDFAN